MFKSNLQQLRQAYQPQIPLLLEQLKFVSFIKGEVLQLEGLSELKPIFPKSLGQPLVQGIKGKEKSFKSMHVGVVLSGGQAAGGHNVISGLYDALKEMHQDSKLFGFLDGPSGIINGKYKEITQKLLDPYRNQGGFDLIGSGRTKIETEEQLDSSLKVIQNLPLNFPSIMRFFNSLDTVSINNCSVSMRETCTLP